MVTAGSCQYLQSFCTIIIVVMISSLHGQHSLTCPMVNIPDTGHYEEHCIPPNPGTAYSGANIRCPQTWDRMEIIELLIGTTPDGACPKHDINGEMCFSKDNSNVVALKAQCDGKTQCEWTKDITMLGQFKYYCCLGTSRELRLMTFFHVIYSCHNDGQTALVTHDYTSTQTNMETPTRTFESSSDCRYGDKTYTDGETWLPYGRLDPCYVCTCDGGTSVCLVRDCHDQVCAEGHLKVTDVGECCPHCEDIEKNRYKIILF